MTVMYSAIFSNNQHGHVCKLTVDGGFDQQRFGTWDEMMDEMMEDLSN